MSHKKIKHELRERIAQSIQEVLATYSMEAGNKLKKSTKNSARKLTNKFIKTLKEVEKAEKKATKKLEKKQNKSTQQWLKSHDLEEMKISRISRTEAYPMESSINFSDKAFGSQNNKAEQEKYHVET